MKRLLLAVVLLAALLLTPAQARGGNDATCVGVLVGTFDNVEVPPGAECSLRDSVVRGNLKALEGARLFVFDSQIAGNIQGDKANVVQVFDSLVGGNIEVVEFGDAILPGVVIEGVALPGGSIAIAKGDRGGFGDVFVVANTLPKGNLKLEANTSDFFSLVADNTVGGDAQIFKNRGSDTFLVAFNLVGQNLQCKENGRLFSAEGNAVGDNAEDQCAGADAPALRAAPAAAEARAERAGYAPRTR